MLEIYIYIKGRQKEKLDGKPVQELSVYDFDFSSFSFHFCFCSSNCMAVYTFLFCHTHTLGWTRRYILYMYILHWAFGYDYGLLATH